MEKPKAPPHEYQGDSPRWAAAKQLFASSAFYAVGLELIVGGAFAIFTKQKPGEMLDEIVQGIKRRAPWEFPIIGIFSAWDAKNAYSKAVTARTQHDQLLADNIAMRGQLNQTGQILRHVAKEVEKGTLADSQMTLDESAVPPSHVARLEAANAAKELAAAVPRLSK